jgi:predicted aspartyl protease
VGTSAGIKVTEDGRTPFVTVQFGHWQAPMVVDTGATGMAVSEALAANLVQQGDAYYLDGIGTARIADGSTVVEQQIMIDTVMVGSHVVHNVRAGVTQGDNLLPFPIIVQMGLLVPGAQS